VKEILGLFAILTDPARLRLLRLVLRQELCVCELMDALQMPQYKVSRQLRLMRSAGLVEASRSGRWMHYRISRKAASSGFHQELLKLLDVQLRALPEVKRDDTRLRKRLALRRAGRCVVGQR
jgi:ArsR family transcriptional regulator